MVLVVCIAAVVLFVLFYLLKNTDVFAQAAESPVRYSSQTILLSVAEQRFFDAMRQACEANEMLCPKVRLADVLRCPKGEYSQSAFNKISSKHIDFVLIESTSSRILAVIELDDKSHNSHRAQVRDTFVDQALASAGIPVVRVKAAAQYEISVLRRQLQFKLRPPLERNLERDLALH